jgi:hypothetical protein
MATDLAFMTAEQLLAMPHQGRRYKLIDFVLSRQPDTACAPDAAFVGAERDLSFVVPGFTLPLGDIFE